MSLNYHPKRNNDSLINSASGNNQEKSRVSNIFATARGGKVSISLEATAKAEGFIKTNNEEYGQKPSGGFKPSSVDSLNTTKVNSYANKENFSQKNGTLLSKVSLGDEVSKQSNQYDDMENKRFKVGLDVNILDTKYELKTSRKSNIFSTAKGGFMNYILLSLKLHVLSYMLILCI